MQIDFTHKLFLLYLHGLPGDASYWRAESGYVIGYPYRSVSCGEIGRKNGFWIWRMSGNRTCDDDGTLSGNESSVCDEEIGCESEMVSGND